MSPLLHRGRDWPFLGLLAPGGIFIELVWPKNFSDDQFVNTFDQVLNTFDQNTLELLQQEHFQKLTCVALDKQFVNTFGQVLYMFLYLHLDGTSGRRAIHDIYHITLHHIT